MKKYKLTDPINLFLNISESESNKLRVVFDEISNKIDPMDLIPQYSILSAYTTIKNDYYIYRLNPIIPNSNNIYAMYDMFFDGLTKLGIQPIVLTSDKTSEKYRKKINRIRKNTQKFFICIKENKQPIKNVTKKWNFKLDKEKYYYLFLSIRDMNMYFMIFYYTVFICVYKDVRMIEDINVFFRNLLINMKYPEYLIRYFHNNKKMCILNSLIDRIIDDKYYGTIINL